jgi:hypothetical protein
MMAESWKLSIPLAEGNLKVIGWVYGEEYLEYRSLFPATRMI